LLLHRPISGYYYLPGILFDAPKAGDPPLNFSDLTALVAHYQSRSGVSLTASREGLFRLDFSLTALDSGPFDPDDEKSAHRFFDIMQLRAEAMTMHAACLCSAAVEVINLQLNWQVVHLDTSINFNSDGSGAASNFEALHVFLNERARAQWPLGFPEWQRGIYIGRTPLPVSIAERSFELFDSRYALGDRQRQIHVQMLARAARHLWNHEYPECLLNTWIVIENLLVRACAANIGRPSNTTNNPARIKALQQRSLITSERAEELTRLNAKRNRLVHHLDDVTAEEANIGLGAALELFEGQHGFRLFVPRGWAMVF